MHKTGDEIMVNMPNFPDRVPGGRMYPFDTIPWE